MTPEQYYSPANKAISNSKVGDFLKSKEYFHAKHIARTIEEEMTPAMQLGRMVDMAISEGTAEAIHRAYEIKVLKKDDPDRFAAQKIMLPERLVTDTVMDKALSMTEAIMREPFYRWYNSLPCERQVPIFGQLVDGGLTVQICGLPDFRAFEEGHGTIYIDDLKTSAPSHMRSTESWYWHCQDYGYFRQLAAYRFMTAQQHPGRKIVCRHIAISSQKDGRYQIRLFTIPERLLIPAFYEFGTTAIAIATEKEWKDAPIDWDQAVTLEEPTRKKPEVEE